MEFAPTDNVTIVLDGFVSNMEASNYNRNYMLWGARILGGGPKSVRRKACRRRRTF